MGKFGKALVVTGIGGGLVAGGLYFRNLKNAAKQLQVISSVNIYSLSLTGLTLKIGLVIKNPSSIGFTIKYPFVRLMLGGDMIGSSQVVNQDIKIPAFGEVHVDRIMVDIPIMGLLSLLSSLITPLQSGQSVKITIVSVTAIKIWWMTIPYEEKQEVLLKTGTNASQVTTSNTARKKIQQPDTKSPANGNNSQAGGDGAGHSAADSASSASNQGTDQNISQTA